MSVSRVASCFICSTSTGATNTISLIQDTSNLQSGKKLLDIVSEIAEKPLKEEDIHSTVICKKCSQTCKEYDDLQVRLKTIKSELHGQINKNSESPTKPDVKKVVLPASKLHPLPPDFVLNVGRLPGVTQKAITTIPSKLSLKVTVGSSVLTQSIKTTSALAKNIVIQKPETIQSQQQDLVFEESSLPKDFISSVVLQRIGEDGNNDDQAMEIDEDCSYAIVTQEDGTSEVTEKKSDEQSMFDVSLLSSLEDSGGENEAEANTDQYIVGKLEILSEREDEDDEEQTIVMSDENSIFRVVSGQKLVYSEAGLELLSEDADTQADSQDDEDSQIELQVSGDEETANAIIAAAREQGGAFIKVQSGEMYRVKSVQSKPKEDEETDFTDHLQIVVKEDGVFKCLLCKKNKAKGSRTGRCAGDADFIMRHMRTQHDARVYICRTCDKVLRRRDHYIAHVAQHATENSSQDKSKFHECDVCHKKYSSKTLLMEHMNLHNGQRPYTCRICHKSFASKYTHQSHLKTHLDRPRPFKCESCGKCFFTLQNLNQHHKTHSGIKEFECNICGKAFGTQHNLEMHGVVHSGQKPFVCGVCGKGFARRAEVKDHMRIHTGERPFACDVCGATFSQRSNLHSHKRATHYDDKRYKCDQCPKRFKRRRLLDYHIKASHTGERPLKCEVCKATFVYPEHYKKHARIHSGEKPYVCEVCGKSFNSRDNRNTHRFVHSDKKPYECLVCGAGYMRKRLLYSHMNSQGHLAESIVVNQPRVTIQRVADLASVDNVYESTEELELESEGTAEASGSRDAVYIGDKKYKYVLEEGKTSLNLVPDTEDILTYNLEGALKTDSNFLEAVTAEQLGDESQMAEGGCVRVVQVALPGGRQGWVAVNP
ncbi:zinc finger protein 420-like isoform X2 [Cydia pomonella]|uniref:zinc finger protein 420-like isoform X2 n=1 Tax=Cydia pomonella TaxID=82600 RepID=UPI002ADD58F0|nr:zinc finger protein 420-like isoform X2 [Cydia pomonella]